MSRDKELPEGSHLATDRVLEVRQTPLGSESATLLERRPMPRNFSISLRANGAADRQLMQPAAGARLQPMAGFDEAFTDIIDFILRVTHRIWEEKSIGYLYEHYRHNARVMDDNGLVYGRDQVIEATTQFIAAFPDLRLFADEIIWAGDEKVGFYTSHRCVITGHNTGYSQFGPPTGRKIVLTCIANCRSERNQIDDEHVIYNTGSLVRQLGFDIHAKAREMAGQLPTSSEEPPFAGEVERLLGQGSPAPMAARTGSDFDPADFIRRGLHYLWNWRLLDRVDQLYAPTVLLHGPTDRELYGRGDLKAYFLSLLAMFPDLAHHVDDLYWMGNDDDGYLAAVRWSLVGTHRGPGYLGRPTGRRVRMWGITHVRIVDGRIHEE